MTDGRIYDVAAAQRAALLAGEREVASRLTRAYGDIWQRIQIEVSKLLAERSRLEEAGLQVDIDWLFERGRLDSLLRQVEFELRVFAGFATDAIVAEQATAIDAALLHTEQLVSTATHQAHVSLPWARLPTAAIEDLVGFTANGSPLRTLLDRLGPAAMTEVQDALIQGLALGYNPRDIALSMRRGLGGSLGRALTVARTEIIRAYREATWRSYQANADVVDGWVWNCACTVRSCAVCWAMHGTVHPLTERLHDHPNGRCTMLPHVKAVAGLGAQALPESGPTQFARLTPEQQDGILGRAAGQAYRAGKIRLEDVVARTFDPDWGPGFRGKSLAELGV